MAYVSFLDAEKPIVGYGLPPDGKYKVYTTMSLLDFLNIYTGTVDAMTVSAMVLSGRLKVSIHFFFCLYFIRTPNN